MKIKFLKVISDIFSYIFLNLQIFTKKTYLQFCWVLNVVFIPECVLLAGS